MFRNYYPHFSLTFENFNLMTIDQAVPVFMYMNGDNWSFFSLRCVTDLYKKQVLSYYNCTLGTCYMLKTHVTLVISRGKKNF